MLCSTSLFVGHARSTSVLVGHARIFVSRMFSIFTCKLGCWGGEKIRACHLVLPVDLAEILGATTYPLPLLFTGGSWGHVSDGGST